MTAEQDRCRSRIAHESGVVLACMLDHEPGYSATSHANPAHRATWNDDDDRVIAGWPDQPTDADTAVEQLEVHHAQGRKRTDEEAAVLEPKYATGGIVESGVDGDNPPSWLTGCTAPNGGYVWPDQQRRVRLSGGRVDVPAETARFFGDEFFARINAVQPPAGLVDGEATR